MKKDKESKPLWHKRYVMRQNEIPLEEIKKGDIFRLTPAGESDLANVNPHQWYEAQDDAIAIDDGANAKVVGNPIGEGKLSWWNCLQYRRFIS